VFLFNAPIPDPEIMKLNDEFKFNTYVSTGGNVLGACLYIAKAIMGANPIIFMGADFSFGYNHKFHGWNSKYDATLGATIKVTDVFGNKVHSYPSYYNFKHWFDYVCTLPGIGIWINCTEGGCLGAYPEGNICQIMQMDLKDCLKMYNINECIRPQSEDPTKKDGLILF
jgi:hypothetical protein